MNSLPLVLLSKIPALMLPQAVHTLEVIDQEVPCAQNAPDLINRLDTDKSPRPDGWPPSV